MYKRYEEVCEKSERMVKEDLKREIENNFQFLKGKVFAILLFGSFVRGEETSRSDIDICLVLKDMPKKKVWNEVLESGLTCLLYTSPSPRD